MKNEVDQGIKEAAKKYLDEVCMIVIVIVFDIVMSC